MWTIIPAETLNGSRTARPMYSDGIRVSLKGAVGGSRSVLSCARWFRPLTDKRSPDNTNAEPEVRAKWVAVARKYGVPIRCLYFTAPPDLCRHNNAVRALNAGAVSFCDELSSSIILRADTTMSSRASDRASGQRSIPLVCGTSVQVLMGGSSDEPRKPGHVAKRRLYQLRLAIQTAQDRGRLSRHPPDRLCRKPPPRATPSTVVVRVICIPAKRC